MSFGSGNVISFERARFPHSPPRLPRPRRAGADASVLATLLGHLTDGGDAYAFAQAVAADMAQAFEDATLLLIQQNPPTYHIEASSEGSPLLFTADLTEFLKELQGRRCERYDDLSSLDFWDDATATASALGRSVLASTLSIDGVKSLLLCFRSMPNGFDEADERLFSAMSPIGHEAVVRLKAARDRRLGEGKARQASKLEALGNLASGVAHEINSPVQFVTDNLKFLGKAVPDLLAAVPVDELSANGKPVASDSGGLAFLRRELPQAITEAIEGMEKIAGIVTSMRGLAHPGGLRFSPCDINASLASVIKLSRGELKPVADVFLHLDPSLPQIEALGGELDQVWLNLVVNAVHALKKSHAGSSGGRGYLAVRTRREHPGEIIIEIEDSGIGIPGDCLEKIFDPFFTTKDVGEGTGQGLAIAYDIVANKHGGRIEVMSQPGEGTCFTIILPARLEGGSQRVLPSSAS